MFFLPHEAMAGGQIRDTHFLNTYKVKLKLFTQWTTAKSFRFVMLHLRVETDKHIGNVETQVQFQTYRFFPLN